MGAPQAARAFLVRGLLVGVVAGFAAFVVAYFLGEPGIVRAIAVEQAASSAAGAHDGQVEIVSRTVQSTVGLATATVAFGASFGGLFGLACAVAQGRLGALRPRAAAAVLAAVGFVTITLVPFIKYPANPPAVGDPATIGRRTILYFLMVALSLLFVVAGVYVARRLPLGRWDRVLAGTGLYLLLVVASMALLPRMQEVGPDFPAAVLWSFRTGSLATLATLWLVLGTLYGALTERSLAKDEGARAMRRLVTSEQRSGA